MGVIRFYGAALWVLVLVDLVRMGFPPVGYFSSRY
jgi:hypothetical protein